MQNYEERTLRPMALEPTVWLMFVLWIALLCAALLPEKAHAQTLDINGEMMILPSVARTATLSTPNFGNAQYRGLHLIINMTAVPGVQTVTPSITAQDPVSGTTYTILTGPAISTTGITILKVYPGIGTVANGSASDLLPNLWGVTLTHSGAGSFTYSVSAYMER